MRRITACVALALFTATVVVFTVAAQPQPQAQPEPQPRGLNGCTRVGTPTRNVWSGSPRRDVLCPVGGSDYVHSAAGPDLVRGGSGKDTLIGGKGQDKLQGQAGNDRLFSTDSQGSEQVVGGPGRDQCFIDRDDRTSGCERVFIGYTQKQSASLERVALNVITIIDELAPPIPTPVPPGGTVTITEVITVPCFPGPPQPPPFCDGA